MFSGLYKSTAVAHPIDFLARLLCAHGAAGRSARDRRPTAGHHPCRAASHPSRVTPSTVSYSCRACAGGGRGDMSQTRRLAAIAADVAGIRG